MSDALPFLYTAVYRKSDGHEGSIDFEESGWLSKTGLKDATTFTLQPKVDSGLPVISVDLKPLPDGTRRELVIFTRVYGRLSVNDGSHRNLFRMYCLGWKAEGLCSVQWIYPSGSIVCMAGEDPEKIIPPYVDELIEHYCTKDLPKVA